MLRSIVGPAASPASKEQQARAMRLSCLLPEETVPPVWQTMLPDHGVRERPCAQVATRLRGREDRTAAGCSEAKRTSRFGLAALRAATCAGGGATAGSRDLLSTQIVRKPGESNFDRLTTAAHFRCEAVVNACQEYEARPVLATAKFERRRARFALAHPPRLTNPRG